MLPERRYSLPTSQVVSLEDEEDPEEEPVPLLEEEEEPEEDDPEPLPDDDDEEEDEPDPGFFFGLHVFRFFRWRFFPSVTAAGDDEERERSCWRSAATATAATAGAAVLLRDPWRLARSAWMATSSMTASRAA